MLTRRETVGSFQGKGSAHDGCGRRRVGSGRKSGG